MKKAINIKAFSLYEWVIDGTIYLLLWLIIDLSSYPNAAFPIIINNIWLAVYIVFINFIFFEYGLPFLRRKRESIFINIVLSVFVASVLLLLYSFGLYGWRSIGVGLHIYTVIKIFASVKALIFYIFPQGLLSVFFFGILKHLHDHIKLKQFTQQLRIEKQEAELNYLRSQTNPHFLFNTLNNIYALARDKSDLAPESVLRLSKILRFMLYETGGAFIAIEDELAIINDYIALEKLRYDDSLQIGCHYAVEDLKQALPPLLLIPLVENAFKHGVSETGDHPFVTIDLSVQQQQLVFFVKNSTERSSEQTDVKENIGLSNLRRQLELLYTEYHLSVQQGGSWFAVTLQINLASHV